jgi:nicotinic acid phosphoribosyltransferase
MNHFLTPVSLPCSSDLADTDAYKLSMQAAIQQLYPDATVK